MHPIYTGDGSQGSVHAWQATSPARVLKQGLAGSLGYPETHHIVPTDLKLAPTDPTSVSRHVFSHSCVFSFLAPLGGLFLRAAVLSDPCELASSISFFIFWEKLFLK